MSIKPEQPSSVDPPDKLISAIEKVLRPLVRLLMSYQITYPILSNILKSVYIDIADTKFKVDDKRQSDSRINLLTGVHRKDVKRLRSLDLKSPSHSISASTGAQIIGIWLGASEFTDKRGLPKPLPFNRGRSNQSCFEDLVTRVLKNDIRPRVVLEEWLRLGVAHLDDENNVVLNTNAFTPEVGFDEKIYFFAKNLQDHIDASSHNLLGNKPPYFDRSVYYDRLTRQSVEELAELADTLGMAALTKMNKQALSRQLKDKNKTDATYRTNFGIFNFNENYLPPVDNESQK